MDIDGWLRRIGLEQYVQTFRDNAIDADVLRDLTDQHLRELGLPLGARLKILRAAAALGANERLPASPEITPVAARTDAERRQLTVMFCDLVGSTALSARLDPEDTREVVGAYHRCCDELITKAGGFVAKYMGDGVLAYFGYPQAHEHDAERCVLAGLALVEAVPKLETAAKIPLQVRVGIATGLVVVGDLIGTGAAQEEAVIGETPNLAARLQGIAEPGAVIIADGTRRLLGSLFELQDLGARELKGLAGPPRAWAALRASAVASRFEALHTASMSALVGREEELELLLRRWSRAKTGAGQVVLLSGEAGIGKSRLTAALLERLAHEPHTRLRYFCSPQRADSAFHPFIGQMERAAGLGYGDAPRAKLDKLDAVLARTSTSPQDAALLAEMLSLPNDGRYPVLALSPEQRRQKALEALMSQLAGLARSSPVLMILEDVHWIDPTSLEVFGRVVDGIKALPVLLVVTFRPEFNAPWVGQSHVASLTLNRLGEREVAGIIAGLVGNKTLPAEVMAEIVERTDGIPLFVEEMTKAVLEAESEGAARRTVAAVPSPSLAVPASLHASLMARLDRLGPAREVAQIGAAIGRQFSHALLASVARKLDTELASALDRLVQAGLLFRQGMPPHASYLFKHALVQDAAYGTLLRDKRRALHGRIAETLESQFAETDESRPEILARHCTEAGLIEKAAGLWGKAGQRSIERSALIEAVEQLTRALAQIATLPATPALRREEIRLQAALISPLLHVKGYAAPETKAAAEQAHRLLERAEALGDPPQDPFLMFSVLWGVWLTNLVAFKGEVLHALSSEFLLLAEREGSTLPLMVGHRMMGTTLQLTGDNAGAIVHYDKSLALYDPVEHRLPAMRFVDARVAVLSFRALTLWVAGYPDKAVADAEHAIEDAREIGQAAPLMLALCFASIPHVFCGNYATANALLDEGTVLAGGKGAFFWKAFVTWSKGSVSTLTGKAADAVQMLGSALAAWRSMEAALWKPLILTYLTKARAELGQFDDALRSIGDAVAAVETTGERWYKAEIHRTAGEIELQLPARDETKAMVHFERALAVARQQQAKSLELRAAMSIARLWCSRGQPDRARELLAPVYGWFTEGFDTLDLKQAKTLLDTLA